MSTITKLISKGSKNRLVRSEGFDDSSIWVPSGSPVVTANSGGTLDPLGGNTAELINDNNAADVGRVAQTILSTNTLLANNFHGGLITFSCYLKNSTSTKTRILLQHVTGGQDVRGEIDWAAGTITKITTGSPAYANVEMRTVSGGGGGWVRAAITLKYNGTGNLILTIAPASDGTVGLTGAVWAWGAQIEEGPYATTYVPVTGTADPIVPDYPTIPAWITATNADTTNINIGQLLNETYVVTSGQIIFNGSGGTSTTNYRRLSGLTNVSYSTSQSFDPVTNTGARIVCTFADTGTNACIQAIENRVSIDNLGIIADFASRPTSGNNTLIWIDRADDCRLWNLVLEGGRGRSTNLTGILFAGTDASNKALRNTAFDCIVIGCGPLGNGGINTGYLWNNFAELGGAYNCLAWGMRRFAWISFSTGTFSETGTGFINAGQASSVNYPRLINCVALDCDPNRSFVGQWLDFRNNLSSDGQALAEGTTIGNPGVADPASLGNIASNAICLSPTQQDFRPRPGSILIDKGSVETTAFTNSNGPGSTAPFGSTTSRPSAATNPWDIGPYNGVSLPITTSFSVATKTIGRDPSRNYSSLGAFVADLPRSLYYLNQKWVGVCYADGLDEIGETIELQSFNCIVGSGNNIEIKAATNYDPKTQAGHKIKLNMDVDTQTKHRSVLWATPNYLKISGIQFQQAATSATTKNCRVIELTANDCEIDAITCLFDGTYSRSLGYCFDLESDGLAVTNCLAKGSGTVTQGANSGFNLNTDCQRVSILHCVAYSIKGGTSAQSALAANGFVIRTGVTAIRVSGCIAMGTDGTGVSKNDFGFGASLSADSILDHCISGDATALGARSFINQTDTVVFKSPSTGDLRLKLGSPAINAGDRILDLVSSDILGLARTSPLDIGIYEGVATPPLMATPHPKDAHRFASLWEIQRSDGLSHYFSSTNSLVEHLGVTYKPAGQTSASAKRMEAALKEHSVEVLGAISSTEITAEALAAGVFSGAYITERIVDWRYPWTTPYKIRKYRISNIEYDQDNWRVELVGPTIVLDQKVGELIGIDCPYSLGDKDCQFKLSLVTQVNRSVSSIADDRREFSSSGLSGTGVGTDDYFGKGIITWISGANAGLSMEVKSYTQSTKTLRLTFRAPYAITNGDRFNLVPGCRKRFLLDCVTKFANGINFGGRPFIPGTDKAFDTPQR